MAFGKNLCQTEATPADNNYCGGYAISAVLNDLPEQTMDPMSVYKEIQEFQKTVSPVLQELTESRRRNGTDICLPSSLALYAQAKDIAARICYAKQLRFPTEIIEEEKKRCPEMVKQYDSAEQVVENFAGPDIPYCLVLVNQCHWIAVKRKSEGKGFAVYDPTTGKRENAANKEELKQHLSLMDECAGELIIMLEPVAKS